MTDELKKLASELRQQHAQQTADKQQKCAYTLSAAVGLLALKNKLGASNGR